MNGRQFFEKFGPVIKKISGAVSFLPRRIRLWLFDAFKNKSGKSGILIRYILLRTLAKKTGDNVVVFPGVVFENIENLKIGNNVSIHQYSYIDAEGGIDIGDDVAIAHRCTVLSSNHGYSDDRIPIKYQEMELAKTTLKDNIWIGCGTIILAGVTVGSGCVIGANSTVTKSIDDNSVAVGTPCKVIKRRGVKS
ncbi:MULTISPECIES: acyltransferase [Ruminococcus]|jgi:acetyltransferase-like isoleucine patch superfamily enzyme|uniref:Acetyltransferase (Isoleucine patch superfamily) n=1 Tax=Ruminococcus flavefaciens TaxID=1265 RepID=A0A1M7J4E3_RUMFL|nr:MULTISPECIES: acyltransferase [Ruminococcus]MCR4796211.1 acyltransferase [Ruminococcus sp.]SHM47858.1 Acetyltransferase (isoleucine patch superfamily) [Ruminococcus flavefaciens]